MSTVSTNFEFFRGDAWPFTLDTLTDLAGAAVTDVTSWDCRWTLKKVKGSTVIAAANTTAGAGITTITRGSGLFTWTIPAATTAEITPDVYAYDSEVTDASGNRQTFHGFITVLADQSI